MPIPTVADKLGLSFAYLDISAGKTDVSEREVKLLILAGLSALNESLGVLADPAPAGAGDGYGLDTTTDANTTIPAGLTKVQLIVSSDFTGSFKVGAGAAVTLAGATDYSIPIEAKRNSLLPAIVVTRTAGNYRAYGV